MDLALIRQKLGSLSCNEYHLENSPDERIAAVLLAIYEADEGSGLILTRRSQHLPNHAGQVSFPGGSREPEDASLVATALREAEEETGLKRSLVEVLGELPPLTLPSGFWVSPVVGLVRELPELRPDPVEVEEIFTLPLSALFQDGLFQQDTITRNNFKRDFYYIDYKDYYIWGATAAMLRDLAAALGAKVPPSLRPPPPRP